MKEFLLLCCFLLMGVQPNADAGSTPAEIEIQQQLLAEMQSLTPLIHQAQKRSDRQRKLAFNYPVFRADLNTLITGLQLAISGQHQQSFAYPALAGEYGMVGTGEAEAIQTLLHELQALEPLIIDAESKRDAQANIQFQYQGFQDDLLIIRAALQSALNLDDQTPNTLAPLRGQFSSQ